MIRKVTTTSKRGLQASYAVSLLVVKAKKPFIIVEKLLLPAAKVPAETMLDKPAADKFNAVPLSKDTVSLRVDIMITDIVDQVVAKLTGSFALQLDESTDVSGSAQLVGFVRYSEADDIAEHILFCKNMQGRTTGKDIFNVVDAFFAEKSLNWTRCGSIFTDAAASMTGTIKRFVTLAKEKNPNMICIMHRKALALKRMSPQLHDVLNCSIKVINFIKSRPLNSRLFRLLCEKMEAEHTQLLLHTEVRWLFSGRILTEKTKTVCGKGLTTKLSWKFFTTMFVTSLSWTVLAQRVSWWIIQCILTASLPFSCTA